MKQFKDRLVEKKFLEEEFKRKKARFIVLYGRRRIGKTELLKEFITGKKALYFLARKESKEETFKRLSIKLAELLDKKELIITPISSFDGFFTALKNNLKKGAIVIFDEFPLLLEKFPSLPSIIQDYWDDHFKNSKLFLVLCGSSISMMEEKVLGHKSPLYGRRTNQWMLKPIQFKDIKEFFPKYSAEDLIKVYGILDGIPGYLVQFDPSKDIFTNIKKQIFSKGSFLYEEIDFLLNEEFRDPSNYMSLLLTIASGATKFSEIIEKSSIDKSIASKYLHTLTRLHIIKRVMPFSISIKQKLKPTKGLYELEDNFFSFWFRFVYPMKEETELGQLEKPIELLNISFNEYIGKIFEKVCLSFIRNSKQFKNYSFGKWWDKGEEIDIVGIDKKTNKVIFCEVKWKEISASQLKQILNNLKRKSSLIKWNIGKRDETYCIIAKKINNKKQFQQKKLLLFDIEDTMKLNEETKRELAEARKKSELLTPK